MNETRDCVECSGIARKNDGSDTLYTCQKCGLEFMDNPNFNKRFNLWTVIEKNIIVVYVELNS